MFSSFLTLSSASVTACQPCHVFSPTSNAACGFRRTALSCLLRVELYPLRVLRSRTPVPAWARRAVGEGVKSCPGTYPAGATFDYGRRTLYPLNKPKLSYSHDLLHRDQPKPFRFRARDRWRRRLMTRAFDPRRLRWFATCSCKPGGHPISHAACCGTLKSETHKRRRTQSSPFGDCNYEKEMSRRVGQLTCHPAVALLG